MGPLQIEKTFWNFFLEIKSQNLTEMSSYDHEPIELTIINKIRQFRTIWSESCPEEFTFIYQLNIIVIGDLIASAFTYKLTLWDSESEVEIDLKPTSFYGNAIQTNIWRQRLRSTTSRLYQNILS